MAVNGVELATAYVTLAVDGSKVDQGVRRSLSGVDAQADAVGRSSGKKMGSGISAGVLGAVGKLAGPIAAVFAGMKLGQILGDSITAGSDFQQALGGADAVFKGEAAGIKQSAEEAANALGLSKNAYLELATVLGASLKNKGITDFAGQSEDLITIGADLAAQFGGPTKDAVDALASALRGESDPIERYGVSLNETAVNAKLAEMGVKKVNGQFTEQQKTMARLALITEQTADAQGAFGRESDTFAGKQARLAATWENIKTQVGTALLPALTSLSDWFLKKGLPAIQEFGGWVKDELWPALRDGWETVRPGLEQAQQIIADAFGGDNKATIKGFAEFFTNTLIPVISTFVNEWLPIMARQLGATIAVIKLVWGAFITLRDVVISATNVILGALSKVLNTAADMFDVLSRVPGFGWAADAAKKLRNAADKADDVADALARIKDKTVDVTVRFNTTYRNTDLASTFQGVGGRATGGPVRKGQPYIVGEHRPELFVPDQNGRIIPRVPDSTAAPAEMGGFDYWRMGDAVAGSLAGVSLAVGVRETDRAIARHRNTRQVG